MPFQSILFTDEQPLSEIDALQQPACFADLNLDQVVAAMIAGREEYELAPFFYRQLSDVESVAYRQDVLRDIADDERIAQAIETFAAGMREMRTRLALASKLHYRLQKQAWLLEAIADYVAATDRFARDLSRARPRSQGVRAFCAYLVGYASSSAFTALSVEAEALKRKLGDIAYAVTVDGNRVRVDDYRGEVDYSTEVRETFSKFSQGAVKDHHKQFFESADMNHVEAQILDLVARLNPEVFAELARFCRRHDEYLDPTLARFDREVQFYLAYRDYTGLLAQAGLSFCYPHLSESSRRAAVKETFDVALAGKLAEDGSTLVRNDWRLEDPERIFVVSGPNQGGKTTFARTFGQLHYLASLGCTVAGSEATLPLVDRVFTHFEKQEDLSANRGKLEDDLARVHEMLEHATPRSVVVMNESFSSTALKDALYLGERVLERLIELEVLAVYVTFVDELASLDEAIVSVTSTVDPDDPTVRTFKVTRKAADGRAYALAIAKKHGLTYETLKEAIAA